MFLLDNGASSNFVSLDFDLRFGLVHKNASAHNVRLANGKIVRTVGCVVVSVVFGKVHYCGKYYVLNCAVPLILGMEFLSKMKPLVDFENKQVSIVHAQKRY